MLRGLPHRGPVVALAFRADGTEFVTGSWDGAARIWKTATGEQVGPLLTHKGKVLGVDMSRDGHTVLTCSEDWTAQLWSAATGQPIGPPLRHQDQVRAAAFRPDGKAAVTVSDDQTGQLWPVAAPRQGPPDQIKQWVEALTCMRRSEDGAIHLLDPAEWEKACLCLGEMEPVPPEDRLGWHRQQARLHEMAGQWRGAAWNLDRLIAADPKAGLLFQRRGKTALAMGDLAGARRDFDKATALLPEEWEPWFLVGQLAIGEGRWQDGIDNLNKALKIRTKDQEALGGFPGEGTGPIRVGRGYAWASLGQWKEAAEDLAIVRNSFEKLPPSTWADYALVLLKQGDMPGHVAACKQMLNSITRPEDEPKSTIVTTEFGWEKVHHFGKPFEPEVAATMTWVCSLAPAGLDDFSLPLRLAQRAATLDKESYPFARAYGAALYRAKDYATAVKQLETALSLKKTSSPSVWFFLAMAHQRREQNNEAKEWLRKGRAWIEESRKRKLDDGSGLAWERLPWTERAALELLEAEADKLIQGAAAKP
jgi:tetratricopeptide (TPR) repeat protein